MTPTPISKALKRKSRVDSCLCIERQKKEKAERMTAPEKINCKIIYRVRDSLVRANRKKRKEKEKENRIMRQSYVDKIVGIEFGLRMAILAVQRQIDQKAACASLISFHETPKRRRVTDSEDNFT